MIHNSVGPNFFLDSWDISDRPESGVKATRIMNESVKKSQEYVLYKRLCCCY